MLMSEWFKDEELFDEIVLETLVLKHGWFVQERQGEMIEIYGQKEEIHLRELYRHYTNVFYSIARQQVTPAETSVPFKQETFQDPNRKSGLKWGVGYAQLLVLDLLRLILHQQVELREWIKAFEAKCRELEEAKKRSADIEVRMDRLQRRVGKK